MRFRLLALAAGFGLSTVTFAASFVAAQGAVVDCGTAPSQIEMNQCAMQVWQVADQALNLAYKKTMADLKALDADLPTELKGGAEKLKSAQRAWVTYRDDGCAAEGFPMRGGSAEPVLYYGCMAQVTNDRTKALKDLSVHLAER